MERPLYLCFNESVHCVDLLLVFIIIDFNISRAAEAHNIIDRDIDIYTNMDATHFEKRICEKPEQVFSIVIIKHALKTEEDRVLRIRLPSQSHQVHPTVLTVIQQLCSMKQKHTKYTQINTNEFTHSEMSPV